jgi:hypothetical protein
MKLNKIEAVTATTSEDVDGNQVESKPTMQLRYLKDDGTYHRCTCEADADLTALPNLSTAELALVDSVAKEAALIPVDSDIAQLHFYPTPTQAVFAADPSGKVGQDGVADEPRFGMVGIKNRHKSIPDALVAPCFKCEETGEIKDTDLAQLPADAQGFANAVYAHEAGIYKEIVKLKSLEDEPDYQAFDVVTTEEIKETVEIIDGKAVDVVKVETVDKEVPLFDYVPRFDADGVPLVDTYEVEDEDEDFWEEVEGPKMHPVPRMVKGKKVSDKEKARLKELQAKL